MHDDLPTLFAYDRWANTKILDACRNLTAEQYAAEPVPGWSSIRSTIHRIALATEWNLRALAGDPDDTVPTEADLVLTDGGISYPAEDMPYRTLWVVMSDSGYFPTFEPPYGLVLQLPVQR